jgi:hypothetical protein
MRSEFEFVHHSGTAKDGMATKVRFMCRAGCRFAGDDSDRCSAGAPIVVLWIRAPLAASARRQAPSTGSNSVLCELEVESPTGVAVGEAPLSCAPAGLAQCRVGHFVLHAQGWGIVRALGAPAPSAMVWIQVPTPGSIGELLAPGWMPSERVKATSDAAKRSSKGSQGSGWPLPPTGAPLAWDSRTVRSGTALASLEGDFTWWTRPQGSKRRRNAAGWSGTVGVTSRTPSRWRCGRIDRAAAQMRPVLPATAAVLRWVSRGCGLPL